MNKPMWISYDEETIRIDNLQSIYILPEDVPVEKGPPTKWFLWGKTPVGVIFLLSGPDTEDNIFDFYMGIESVLMAEGHELVPEEEIKQAGKDDEDE